MKKPILTMRDWIEGLKFGTTLTALNLICRYFGILSSSKHPWVDALVHFIVVTVFWAFGYRYFLGKLQNKHR